MERRKRGGGALSQCQFLGILIIGAADATPGFLEAVTSFSIIIQFCNVQVLEESCKIIGWKYVLERKFLLERLIC